jgi:hypothetical protein
MKEVNGRFVDFRNRPPLDLEQLSIEVLLACTVQGHCVDGNCPNGMACLPVGLPGYSDVCFPAAAR